jgi:LacI family transcriptional regulator, galactose operon repressor
VRQFPGRPDNLQPGRVTVRDVARAAGVSITTASRVLHNKGDLRQATRDAVFEAAARLNYVPSEVARALVRGTTATVGAIVTDNASPIYAGVLRGVEDVFNTEEYGVLLANSRDEPTRALRCIRMLNAKAVDGVICTPVSGGDGDVAELRRWGVPLVLVLRYIPGLPVDFVVADNKAGGYMATKHLLEVGHRRIAHIGGREGLSSTDDRVTGYLRALREGDAEGDAIVRRALHTIDDGYRAAVDLLNGNPSPTAIYAATHQQAVGAMKAAREMQRLIPENVAVVGGDEADLAASLEVPLTTVEQPLLAIGERAAEILLRRMSGDEAPVESVFLPPTLNVRESSGG